MRNFRARSNWPQLRVERRTIARWRHFTATTRIPKIVVFLCKLGVLLFKAQRDWRISVRQKIKDEMNFGNCSQVIIMKMAYSPSNTQDISCTTRLQRGWARTDNLNWFDLCFHILDRLSLYGWWRHSEWPLSWSLSFILLKIKILLPKFWGKK